MEYTRDNFGKITDYKGYGDLYNKNDLTREYLFNVLICRIIGLGKSIFVNMFQTFQKGQRKVKEIQLLINL